jgi:hypothetical protein
LLVVQNNINKFVGIIIFVATKQRLPRVPWGCSLAAANRALRRSNPTLKIGGRAYSELAVIRSKSGIITLAPAPATAAVPLRGNLHL